MRVGMPARLDLALIGKMVQMGWSATLQMLIGMCSWIALIRVLSTQNGAG